MAGKVWRLTEVSMGNPHAVAFVDQVESLDLEGIGPLFEHHELFPERTNTEFVRVIDRKSLQMRVWEAGARPWPAAPAPARPLAAAVVNGLAEREATLHLRGGDLQ